MQITTNDVIQKRKRDVFNRTQSIQQRLHELRLEAEELELEHAYLLAEYDMLERVDERGLIHDSSNRGRTDKVLFEDAVRLIFDSAGGIIKVGDLLTELEKFGFEWSNYQRGYYHIKKVPYIRPTGKSGYVQFIRGL